MASHTDSGVLVFDPIAPARSEARQLAHSLETLKGKVVGFIDNAKPNFHFFVDDLADLLVSRYSVASVIKHNKGGTMPVSANGLVDLVKRCDAIVTGAGD